MLMSLPLDARRLMENLLHHQHREQQQFQWLIDLSEPAELERLCGERRARSTHGTGGGRVRRPIAESS